VTYKVTDFYSPETERSIRFDDPELAITWPVERNTAMLSDKDAAAPPLAAFLRDNS
jgi:dTDP-4-dehydrorhamnose 3,5-epimerase